jgi:hypothetical protein
MAKGGVALSSKLVIVSSPFSSYFRRRIDLWGRAVYVCGRNNGLDVVA